MTGDELLAFCKATEVNPDIFVEPEQKDKKPTFNDIRKEHGLSPVEGGDVVLTKE